MTEIADQCMYGLTTSGPTPGSVMPAQKPTRFLSNSWCILQELSTRCDRSHEHQQLVGGRGAKAAIYPDKLCRAICKGFANQKKYDQSYKVCSGGMGKEGLESFIGLGNAALESPESLMRLQESLESVHSQSPP